MKTLRTLATSGLLGLGGVLTLGMRAGATQAQAQELDLSQLTGLSSTIFDLNQLTGLSSDLTDLSSNLTDLTELSSAPINPVNPVHTVDSVDPVDTTDPVNTVDPVNPDPVDTVDSDIPIATSERISAYTDAANIHRETTGFARVIEDEELNAQSQAWAEKLAAEGTFVHDTPTCEQRPGTYTNALGVEVSYDQICLSENIAVSDPGDSPESTVDRWFNSPGHRANMLRANAIAIGHGEAMYTTGPYANQIIAVERLWNAY